MVQDRETLMFERKPTQVTTGKSNTKIYVETSMAGRNDPENCGH